ncbi:hypothetical protein A1D22_00730 [Pasteurellaceae bacterium LFhippo2]|nr:hypothetical protein [Pasteurellaceae bacterium LFhippo2]
MNNKYQRYLYDLGNLDSEQQRAEYIAQLFKAEILTEDECLKLAKAYNVIIEGKVKSEHPFFTWLRQKATKTVNFAR